MTKISQQNCLLQFQFIQSFSFAGFSLLFQSRVTLCRILLYGYGLPPPSLPRPCSQFLWAGYIGFDDGDVFRSLLIDFTDSDCCILLLLQFTTDILTNTIYYFELLLWNDENRTSICLTLQSILGGPQDLRFSFRTFLFPTIASPPNTYL